MAEREIVGWFSTPSGQHIPVMDGESKEDAYKRAMAKNNGTIKHNEDTKQRQIAKNKEQADKLNNQKKNNENPPRRLTLKNVKAEVANKSSDILNLDTKQRYRFKEGTEIHNVYVFAGKGCSKEFRDAAKYAKRYGGKAENWQHCAGWATITNGKRDFVREIHWVQEENGVIKEAFIKFHKKGGN